MGKAVGLIILSVLLLVPVYGRVIASLDRQASQEKLGYLPAREVVRLVSLGHKALVSEWLFFKVITYYGGRSEEKELHGETHTDYQRVYRFLDSATFADPYNIDAYYFTQAIFTWELGWVREANSLLERGVQHRTWDFYLPFFLGFNHHHFLKDYRKASAYMERAAQVSGDPLFSNLAARFRYEADETEGAIAFLRVMIERTWNEKVRATLQRRLRALEAVRDIEWSRQRFSDRYHREPGSVEEMVNLHIIDRLPEDPYGGSFYFDDKGKVRSTSGFYARTKRDHSAQD